VKRTAFLRWLTGIVIAVVVIVASLYFDRPLANFMAAKQTAGMRVFMENVSRFGDWPEHLLLGLVLFSSARWRGNRQWSRIFLAMMVALAIAGLAGRVIKISTGRARPSVKAAQMWNGPRVSGSKYHSFPSGHVDASVGFFGVLFFARRRIGLACIPIPVLIGLSRLYLGAHWLSDVVCAAILGILGAFLVWRFMLPKIGNGQLEIGN
jgi:membrane-associated phospholipid phosphatase